MAVPHAAPGTLIDVRPLGAALANRKTHTLVRTDELEIIRLVLPAGKEIPTHIATGQITVHCLEGHVTFTALGQELALEAGRLLYLNADQPHSLRAVEDSSLLLTILLPRK